MFWAQGRHSGAVHAMHGLYDEKALNGCGVLLVDVRNAFNSVNKPPCGMPEFSGQGMHISYNLIQHLPRICFLGVAWNLRIHTQQTQKGPPWASEAGRLGRPGLPHFFCKLLKFEL